MCLTSFPQHFEGVCVVGRIVVFFDLPQLDHRSIMKLDLLHLALFIVDFGELFKMGNEIDLMK